MSKHNIQNIEFVKCPYCPNNTQNKFKLLHWKHLQKLHNKTLEDVLKEFPNLPTMTLDEYNKKVNTSKMGGQASKQTFNETKIVKCIHCGIELNVKKNKSNKQSCKKCVDEGKENPDGRTKEHANESREKTLKEKYGNEITNCRHIDGVNKRISETFEKKYGGVGFASNELAKKSRDKIREKFGNDNVMKLPEYKQMFSGNNSKMKNPEISNKVSEKLKGKESKLKGRTYEEIHGLEKSEVLKNTRRKTFIDKFNEIFPKLLEQFNFEFLDHEYKGAHIFHNYRCKVCGTILNRQWNSIQQGYLCTTCHPRNNGRSFGEIELSNFIKSVLGDTKVIENSRMMIAPKELDIYIPDLDIAFEYNGLYFHSCNDEDERCHSDPTYHFQKTEDCNKLGIRLIHIFEDEWFFKKEIVKHRIMQILNKSNATRLHARECEIKEIDAKTKKEFLNKYHIQGNDVSRIKLGAFHNDELVALMTFSKGNRAKGVIKLIDGVFELNRFCSNYNYHIPGIAGKLLSYFKRNYEWKEIYSYADRRWSNGDMYSKLGFEQVKGIRLNYWYIKDNVRIHRFSLRKRKDEPKEITERNLRLMEGYKILWDCGNLKFRMVK